MWHLVRLSLSAVLVVACMLFPFLPGEYDSFAVALSSLSQSLALAGVLLVPLGAMWLFYEIRNQSGEPGRRPGTSVRYWLAVASLVAATLFGVAVSLGAWLGMGPSLGLAVIAVCAWGAARLARKLTTLRSAEARTFNPMPLYMVILPLVALISKITLMDPSSDFSRNRAIDNSASLLNDIERYNAANGRYPLSLQAVHKDYKPGVIGIERYHYEPSGEAYNLYFENVPHRFGTREFVMYNKSNQHELASHAMDLLQLSPAELAVQRGYYAAEAGPRPHWKLLLFD